MEKTVTSFSPNLGSWVFNLLVSGLAITYRDRAKPFVHVTAEELVFGKETEQSNGITTREKRNFGRSINDVYRTETAGQIWIHGQNKRTGSSPTLEGQAMQRHTSADVNPDNKCYYPGEKCPPRGLQNISPCQYNAPVYLSFPHFYDADPALLEPFEGLKPNKKKHETYFMIQPGIHELSTPIWRWIYLATTVGPVFAPIITASMIIFGFLTLAVIFIRAYKSLVIGQNSLEIMEIGRQTIRRSSTLIISGSHKMMPHRAESAYIPLNQCGDKVQELSFVRTDSKEFKSVLRSDFVRSSFSEAERESLIRSDNSFIVSEHTFNQD
ncbi:hypothetical protein HF086_018305 [Spodoptera exigua]|uniref:Uncharacterized protein n=2 Tax=Spodoptera exigua TaxID=7107 RepID=A0A922M185_SPOEX|nr:hypothetical protein HF086_018305 [Spodoptera exigua]